MSGESGKHATMAMAMMLLQSHHEQAGRARGSSASVIGVFVTCSRRGKGCKGYGPAGSHSLSGTWATLREGETGNRNKDRG